MLYGDVALTIRHLTWILFAWSLMSKVVVMGRCPSTCTCSPENPAKVPLNGSNLVVSKFIPLNASQYKTSVKLPGSIKTHFMLQPQICTLITVGLFLLARTPSESFMDKLITTESSFPSKGDFYLMCIKHTFPSLASFSFSCDSPCYRIQHMTCYPSFANLLYIIYLLMYTIFQIWVLSGKTSLYGLTSYSFTYDNNRPL